MNFLEASENLSRMLDWNMLGYILVSIGDIFSIPFFYIHYRYSGGGNIILSDCLFAENTQFAGF